MKLKKIPDLLKVSFMILTYETNYFGIYRKHSDIKKAILDVSSLLMKVIILFYDIFRNCKSRNPFINNSKFL